ncbi:MAG: S4 domain-containing protein [Elusimicrobiales bacterium]|nr:S4 domain-containing protein [Elusimicrobiales bacterium]
MENKKLLYSGAGGRLDLFVKSQEGGLSREFVKRLISEGFVRLNGRAVKPAAPLKAGDEVTISATAPGPDGTRVQLGAVTGHIIPA